MPEDYLPTHFLSWLANGPAANDQHPLWLPDTGVAVIKPKLDILDSTASSASMGKSSAYSRKAQRLNKTHGSNTSVLDLTHGEEVSNGLLRESVRNSSQIVSLLKVATDQERQTIDALVHNARSMYELDGTAENKSDYISALQRQKDLLMQRSVKPLAIKDDAKSFDDIQLKFDEEEFVDEVFYDGQHSLDDSFTHEPFENETPRRV